MFRRVQNDAADRLCAVDAIGLAKKAMDVSCPNAESNLGFFVSAFLDSTDGPLAAMRQKLSYSDDALASGDTMVFAGRPQKTRRASGKLAVRA